MADATSDPHRPDEPDGLEEARQLLRDLGMIEQSDGTWLRPRPRVPEFEWVKDVRPDGSYVYRAIKDTDK